MKIRYEHWAFGGIGGGAVQILYYTDQDNSRIVQRSLPSLSWVAENTAGIPAPQNSINYSYGIACFAGSIFYSDYGLARLQWRDSFGYDFIKQYAASPGDFRGLAGVTVTPSNIYISDANNSTILKIDPDTMTISAEYGSFGAGNDQYDAPNDIKYDGSFFYVCDTYNNRIVKRDPDTFAYIAQSSYVFTGPGGVTSDGTHLFIADTGAHQIVKLLCSDLSFVSQIGSNGSGDDQFTWPSGVDCDGTYVYVADTSNNRIVKRLASDLSYDSQTGSYGSGNDQFNSPVHLANDGTYSYVSDSNNFRIMKRLLSDLSYVSKFGFFGENVIWGGSTKGIASDGTYFYVSHANTIYKCLIGANVSSLTYVASASVFDGLGLSDVKQIATDGVHLYVCDFNNMRLLKLLCSDLSFVAKVNDVPKVEQAHATIKPTGVALDATHVYFCDENYYVYKFLKSTFTLDSWGVTQTRSIIALQIDDNNIYICDNAFGV